MNHQSPGGGQSPHWPPVSPPFNYHGMPHGMPPVHHPPGFYSQNSMPQNNMPFNTFTRPHPIGQPLQPPPGIPMPPQAAPGFFPPHQAPGPPPVSHVIDLENRLRGLIMGNAGAHRQQEQMFVPQAGPSQLPFSELPPHMRMAPPEVQQDYLERSRQWQQSQVAAAAAAASPLVQAPQISGSPQYQHSHPTQATQRHSDIQSDVPGPTHAIRGQRGRSFGPGRGRGQRRGGSPQSQLDRPAGAANGAPHKQPAPMAWRQNLAPSATNRGSYINGHAPSQRNRMQPPNEFSERPPPRNRQLYEPTRGRQEHPRARQSRAPGTARPPPTFEEVSKQAEYLQTLADEEVPKAEIDPKELQEKEAFREMLERICVEAVADHEKEQPRDEPFDSSTVALKCFGSIGSGFATRSSDMDLALLSPQSTPTPSSAESGIPRALEKRLLELGIGARLLERTRVPIIKLCEKPSEDLLRALQHERQKWEEQKDKPVAEEDQTATLQAENHAETAVHKHKQETVPTISDGGDARQVAEYELDHLQQLPRETLRQYYRRTKRIMEAAGGRDYTMPQHKLLEISEGTVMNRAGAAYIAGLQQDDLRSNLQSNPSLNFNSGFFRSLFGVYTQAEVELLVLQWKQRNVPETNDGKERVGQGWIDEWKELQKHDNLADILGFNKSATVLWEKIKTLSSISLRMLAQLPNEDPSDYCTRAVSLLKELGGRGLDEKSDAMSMRSDRERRVFDETIHRYMSGIRGESEKTHVEAFFATRPSPSLAMLRLQHIAETELYLYDATTRSSPHTDEEAAALDEYAKLVRKDGPTDPDVMTMKEKVVSLLGPASKRHDRLEFPKTGVGIQCDINFSNQLALHNTTLLRCYAHCDPRVRPMVLFIKLWAKRRQINTPYHGTLSSYGYVLMVLHYLANIAQPPVIPNLQLTNPNIKTGPASLSDEEKSQAGDVDKNGIVDGYHVHFWRDEAEIKRLASDGALTQNTHSLGLLLRDFFAYYAHTGQDIPGHGFTWGADVLSLRTPGGLLTKQEKGWTGARTVTTDDASGGTKEVRCRYLFAIEDPFEVDHNIARTVTHNGIVAIRDEFRRAWSILSQVGKGDGVGTHLDMQLLKELDPSARNRK